MRSDRRRNYFIKKSFQANFFSKFIVLILLEAVLISALFMYIAQGTLTTAYHGTELTIETTGAYFLTGFVLITLIVGAGIAIAGIFVLMYLTHRIGGPLYKFEKTIDEAREGQISQRMHLRDTDQLSELKDKLNGLLAELDERLSGIKKELDGAIELIEKGRGDADFSQIGGSLRKIKSSVEYFKTSK